MVTLLITACLVANMAECKVHSFPLMTESVLSAGQCQRMAMQEVIRWAGENPKWHVAKFGCLVENRKDEKT